MAIAASMVCTRCNKLTNDVDKCSTCGTRLKALQSQERRGWVAVWTGAFVVVVMAAVWIWVDVLLAANGQSDPATAKFVGRLNVAFAFVVIAGVLGVINGWLTAHSGRRNTWLLIGLVVAFVSGLFVACSATGGYQGS